METVVNTHHAKTHLSQLIERAMAGERIVIAKAGKPKVVLSPIPSSEPRRPGRFAGQIHIHESFFEPMTEKELDEFEEGHPGDPLRLATETKLPRRS